MKKIVLIGASGHGKVCAEIAKLQGYDEIIFLDDDTSVKRCGIYPVVGTSDDYIKYINTHSFFVSIGDAQKRSVIQNKIINTSGVIATLIHPNAIVSETATLGVGSVVMAGAIINPATNIGDGVIVNTSSSIDHDCHIENFCHIAVGAHICGGVTIGTGTWVGAGAIVNQYLDICSECIVGSGAVVVNNIDMVGTYVGVPAKQCNK